MSVSGNPELQTISAYRWPFAQSLRRAAVW